MFYKFLLLLVAVLFAATGHTGTITKPDDHAPLGVMGDHTHDTGEWMFSYRYATMHMDGNRDGNSRRSREEVWREPFVVAPYEMDMEMHMFGAMYGFENNFTFMAMLPYVRKTMEHGACPPPARGTGATALANCPAAEFTTRTQGLGDLKLSLLWPLMDGHASGHHSQLQVNIGLSLPTGSTDKKDQTPMGRSKLPYAMQLGSGTYDPMLSVVWKHFHDLWSWGGQLHGTFRIGHNSEGYRLGNEYGATAWMSYTWQPSLSTSLRLDARQWQDIKGRDKDLNPALVPTARTDLRGGKRVDLLAGMNWLWHEGPLADHRLALEFGMPVYQHLDGPQLEVDYRTTIGWQYAF